MCVAIFKDSDIIIPEDTLRTCWKNNPHGAGFMYAEDGVLHVLKGFMDYKEFRDAYREHENKRVVLHFRIASVGEINAENTHPHVVREGVLAFVHNGTISCMGGVRGKGESDTSKFGKEILSQLPVNFTNYKGLLLLVEDFISKSRIILMNNLGEVTIFNAESGEVKDLVWYSNDSYKENTTRWAGNNIEWDEEKQTFITKAVTTTTYVATPQRRYDTREWYDSEDYGDIYGGCGVGYTRNNVNYGPHIQKEKKNTDTTTLADLVYSLSKGAWVVASEEEAIPKTETCTECGNPLFTEVEFRLGVCGECPTNISCPNPDCDSDLTVADFLMKKCLDCDCVVNIDDLVKEEDPTEIPTLTLDEVIILAESCQLTLLGTSK